jgi:LysM repeat protein
MRNRKNKKFLFLFITILLISFTAIIKASGHSKPELVYVTVNPGDTLWEIASDYTNSGKDVRKTIYEIRKYNKLDTAVIIPGQEIAVPLSD